MVEWNIKTKNVTVRWRNERNTPASKLTLIFLSLVPGDSHTSGARRLDRRWTVFGILLLGSVFVGMPLSHVPSWNSLAFARNILSPCPLSHDSSGAFLLASSFPDSKGALASPDLASLVSNPPGANATSSTLSRSADIISEAQRLHYTLFRHLFRPAKYAILIGMAAYENKGDPAISVGEILLLRRLGLKLIFYCTEFIDCHSDAFRNASVIASRFPSKEVIVLFHGGGNVITYHGIDVVRAKCIEFLSRFRMVFFPQSITYMPNLKSSLVYAQALYGNLSQLTMVLRDRQSYDFALKHFRGKPRFLMAPDMAFQMGRLPRTMYPSYDILWIRREDKESAGYAIPKLPPNVSFVIQDWTYWPTPNSKSSMEKAFLVAHNGLTFLQRGRVVITDRLHGHILSTLLDIPHVLIDNPYRKLSSYHHTWTQSSENTLLADSAADAVGKALFLLEKFKDTLPPVVPFMKV